MRNTNTKKNPAQAKFSQELTFFCPAILYPLLVKVFKSETTSLNYFSLNIFHIQLKEVGAKIHLNDTSKSEQTHEHTDGHTGGQIDF